jgi:putative endonuclease
MAEARGRKAETLAAWWLRLQGWRILARRARVPGGEVDLIARRGRVLAFIEVKQRGTAKAAAWALDEYRLRRVAVAAQRLAPRYARDGDDIRTTPCSSCRAASPGTSRTSGTGDKPPGIE